MTVAQDGQFQARIGRITSGKTTAWTIPGEGLASLSEERHVIAGALRRRSTQADGSTGLGVSTLMALPAGAVSVMAGRWLSFNEIGPEGRIPVDLAAMTGDFLAGLVVPLMLALALVLVFSVRTWLRAGLFLAGFALVYLGEQDLARLMPEAYAMIYPPEMLADLHATPAFLPL